MGTLVDKGYLEELAAGIRNDITSSYCGEETRKPRIMRKIADAMRENPKVSHIELYQGYMTPESVDLLLEGLRKNTGLKTLKLPNLRLTDAQADVLADCLLHMDSLHTLDISNGLQSEAAASHVLEALATCPNLQDLNFERNPLGNTQTQQLLKVMDNAQGLRSLSFEYSPIAPEDALAIATAARRCHDLTSFNAGERPNGMEINAVFDDCANPNLLTLRPSTRESAITCDNRRRWGADLNATLHQHEWTMDDMPLASFCQAASLLPSMESQYTGTLEHVEKFKARLAAMPCWDGKHAPSPQALTAPDAQGNSLLDNPLNWTRFDRLADAMQEAGTPLTREALCQTGVHGVPHIALGLMTAPHTVLSALTKHDIPLGAKELLDGNAPSAALNSLLEQGFAQRVFTLDNWRGQPTEELQQVYRALPSTHQQTISNYHSLRTAVSASQQPTQRGR